MNNPDCHERKTYKNKFGRNTQSEAEATDKINWRAQKEKLACVRNKRRMQDIHEARILQLPSEPDGNQINLFPGS